MVIIYFCERREDISSNFCLQIICGWWLLLLLFFISCGGFIFEISNETNWNSSSLLNNVVLFIWNSQLIWMECWTAVFMFQDDFVACGFMFCCEFGISLEFVFDWHFWGIPMTFTYINHFRGGKVFGVNEFKQKKIYIFLEF